MDIHRITASQVFGVPEELVTPLMRSPGQGGQFRHRLRHRRLLLCRRTSASPYGEAKQYIEEYLQHYSARGRAIWTRMIERAKANGYADTLFGTAAGPAGAQGLQRVNLAPSASGWPATCPSRAPPPISSNRDGPGATAGCTERLQARLILQVHDELIVEAPAAEAERGRRRSEGRDGGAPPA
ncbi:MAG: DNA polymerase [Oscillospiraceae bacterium]